MYMKKIIYLSFVSFIILVISCERSVITDKPGCTDEDACNYSSRFNVDDGSCQYPIATALLRSMNSFMSISRQDEYSFFQVQSDAGAINELFSSQANNLTFGQKTS